MSPRATLGALLLATLGCPAGSTLDCAFPETLVYSNGDPSGFVRCGDGAINRVEARDVPAPATLPACTGDEVSPDCLADADCTEGPNGQCVHFDSETTPGFDSTTCACTYHCTSDADCRRGEACIASEVSGVSANAACWDASCSAASDCPSAECGISIFWGGCGHGGGLDCRDTLVDTCRDDDDCDSTGEGGDGSDCGHAHGAFACQVEECAI